MLNRERLREIAEEMMTKEILPFWLRIIDRENQGFYGLVRSDATVDKLAPKGVILHSRILWTFSEAFLMTSEQTYLQAAKHAYQFLLDQAMDQQRGGLYWLLDYKGSVNETCKHSYNQAFGIYALSTYYLASGDEKALDTAMDLFRLLEARWRTPIGYREQLTIDFQPDVNKKLSENGCIAEMTMNTMLHIMEAYTVLFEATESDEVREALRFSITILTKDMYNPEKKRLEVFFDSQMHTLLDLHSYGHDMEASWLIDRALDVLGDPGLSREISPITKTLFDHVMQTAFTDRGVYFECEDGKTDTKRDWWVQAESVVGIINDMQKGSSEEIGMNQVEQLLSFVEKEVKSETGEWYWSTYEDGTHDNKRELAGPWKCPYHNARMCLEILKRM